MRAPSSGRTNHPARLRPGQRVVVLRNIDNDGSYRSVLPGERLIGEGDRGEIIGVGFQEERDRWIYFVAFSRERVVGCLEEDLMVLSASASVGGASQRTGKRAKNTRGGGIGRNL